MQSSRYWGGNQIYKGGDSRDSKGLLLDTRIKEMFLVSAREHSHWSDLKDVCSFHTIALPSKVLV